MTGTAMVEDPRTTNTRTPTTAVVTSSAPDPIAEPPAMPRARFFGLTDDSSRPRPRALTGVTVAIAPIHDGIVASWPGRGRCRQLRAASSRNTTPSTSLSTAENVEGSSGSEESTGSTTKVTTTTTTVMPTTQPTR